MNRARTLAALAAVPVGALIAAAVIMNNADDTPTLAPTATATPSASPTATPTAGAISQPDPTITPGAIITTRTADVCTPGWATKHRRSLTTAEKRHLRIAYGLALTTPVSEWDHLVPLELGGANGITNTWPMTDHAADQRKDRLENHLHADVCVGRLDLATAQREAREFWSYW